MSIRLPTFGAARRTASASSFNHLTPLGARSKAEDEDEDKNKDASRAEQDDDGQDREDGDAKGKKNGKRAADDEKDDDRQAAEDDEGDDEEAFEEDDDTDMRGGKGGKRSAAQERARCAKIFEHRAAARNPALAARLAFTTDLSAKEAIGLLKDTPAPDDFRSGARGASNPNLGAGAPSAVPSGTKALEARWDAAFAKAGIPPRKRH